MQAYNQKIIETPTYIEIYDYEAIITPKRKTIENKVNPERKQQLAWLYEDDTTLEKRKNYDELSAQGQYDSLKRSLSKRTFKTLSMRIMNSKNLSSD